MKKIFYLLSYHLKFYNKNISMITKMQFCSWKDCFQVWEIFSLFSSSWIHSDRQCDWRLNLSNIISLFTCANGTCMRIDYDIYRGMNLAELFEVSFKQITLSEIAYKIINWNIKTIFWNCDGIKLNLIIHLLKKKQLNYLKPWIMKSWEILL